MVFEGWSVIFCGFISLLIGRETINNPEISSGVYGFTGKTVKAAFHGVRLESSSTGSSFPADFTKFILFAVVNDAIISSEIQHQLALVYNLVQ